MSDSGLRRPLPRFSLRALFVAIGGIGVTLGALAGYARFQIAKERAALREGIRMGRTNPASARHWLSRPEIAKLELERDQRLARIEAENAP